MSGGWDIDRGRVWTAFNGDGPVAEDGIWAWREGGVSAGEKVIVTGPAVGMLGTVNECDCLRCPLFDMRPALRLRWSTCCLRF
jgi:hypothetical protein